MYRRRAATFLDDATLQLMHDCACFSIPIIWFWIQSPQVGQRGAYGVHDATGSRPMLSFTAFRSLNLFKFPSSFMAQTGTRAARVVRSNIVQTALRASGLNHAPDDFWAESVFSNPLGFVGGPKYRTCGDASNAQPGVECGFTQVGNGTVRTWPPLPTISAITHCSSRCWRLWNANPATSALRRPHPSRMATIA